MSQHPETSLAGWLGRWVAFCVRYRVGVLFLTFVATAGLGVYVAKNLGIQTDLDNMLDPELPFRKARSAYARAFPQFESQLVLVLDGQTPEDARTAALTLAAALGERPDVFAFPTVPRADPFLEEKGLYYMSEEALLDLSDQLARVQPFLGRLTRDPSLRGLLDMLERALEEAEKGGDYDVSPLVIQLDQAIDAVLSGRPYRLSWQELMAEDEPTPDELRQYVLVQVRKDDEALFSTGDGIALARSLFEDTTRSLPGSPRMRITGSIAMEYEELRTVRRGAEWIGLVTLVLVALVLVLGLRSGRLVWASLLALVVGLVFTAAFATLAVGHLNLISVAFGVLYIGLGVDYAIHLSLRFREAVAAGRPISDALVEATGDVGTSLVLCTFTTAIGFYAFVPTAYKGVSELGLISGTGMFVSLFVSLTFLPALLAALRFTPGRFRPPPPARGIFAFLVDLPVHHRRGVLLGGLVIGLVSLTLLPQARFDLNPLNLRDPDSESVRTFRELVDTSDTPPWSIKILAPGSQAAESTVASLEDLDAVDKVVTLASFVPSGQEEKQFILDDLLLALGPGLLQIEPVTPPTRSEVVRAVRALEARATHYLSAPAGAEDASVESLLPRLATLGGALQHETRGAALVEALEHGLLDTLPGTLGRLDLALQAEPFTRADLPPALQQDWVSSEGAQRLEVFPRENLDDIPALRRFTGEVQAVVGHATGAPITIVASGHAIVGAFQQALLVSIVACFLILWLLLRRLGDVFLVLVPLLFAAAVTGASTVLLGSPFNFANVIAIPLLFGIGVDSGIHVVHRARGVLPASAGGNPIRTSTGRAVVFSALTTVCSFGSLAFSPHPGTASMGLLLAVGVTATVLATLWLLPALAGLRDGRVTR